MGRRATAPVELDPGPGPVVAPEAPQPSIVRSAKLLIFLELEPELSHRELLVRMMSAIQVEMADVALEWGDFPAAQTPFVVGVGLGPKKAARLAALRPDWIVLPSLQEISGDASKKREAWTRLQGLQNLMRNPQ